MLKVIEKPWGKEEVIEINDKYMVKRLTMHDGHQCSIQYHEKKRETIYALSGNLTILIGDSVETLKPIVLAPGESYTIEPFQVHRMTAIGNDAVYLESSTPEMEDVVRLKDDYGRGGDTGTQPKRSVKN